MFFFDWFLKECMLNCKFVKKNKMKYLYKTSNKILEEIKIVKHNFDNEQYIQKLQDNKLFEELIDSIKEEYNYIVRDKKESYESIVGFFHTTL